MSRWEKILDRQWPHDGKACSRSNYERVRDSIKEAIEDNEQKLWDFYAAHALGGWASILAARRGETGYTDDSAACEAARLSAISADAMMAVKKKNMEAKDERD
jgi:hypothetical protein